MIAAFLRSCRFPAEQFTREMLVWLSEVDFKEVPRVVTKQLEEFAAGLNSTLLVENMFNALRRVERIRLNNAVSPKAAWHEQTTSRGSSNT